MKIFSLISSFVVGTSAQEERKVPPRTPPQRLNTLRRFASEWVQMEIGQTVNRPNRASTMTAAGITRIFDTITEAYEKCGFFDPTLPHGGPRPVTERRKRSSDEKFFAAERRRIAREIADNNDLDIFDKIFEEEFDETERGFALARLSAEPNLAWKQIGTGFRKWILRYLAECYGEVTYNNHSSRLEKIHGRIKDAYTGLFDEQNPDETL
ncbi:Oidioi.mRNA.OKI2018_I69.chr2.g5325.t1.cds [Oikopleura dioica]|uniref:Oidioi.mRNA.OKI2018_I69.chr2.g5325.t1.cds n=1 Tax=Oikopleura dioica TaxID=34765 RepID=A0ABN7SZQ7_OIKDI|nr:Oidioi.mRNA.OKI2018_I69.chr2.g5325.t1.cds [Oikopleura dioica]